MSGGTGVIGRAVVPALLADGDEVVVTHRHPAQSARIAQTGAQPVLADLFDLESLEVALRGADAVVNLASRLPVGYAVAVPRAWRSNDRLCVAGVRNLAEAARRSGVRRLVQHSTTLLYADGSDDWITEASPLGITTATEPISVAESHVQQYACGSRTGVVLRLGRVVGDGATTRNVRDWDPRHGSIDSDGWVHLLHAEDLGTAVVAALHAPSGTYNVGAEPVRRTELRNTCARQAGSPRVVLAPVLRRLAAARLEPLTRSLRVSSDEFTAHTGWHPRHPRFTADWLDAEAEPPGSGGTVAADAQHGRRSG